HYIMCANTLCSLWSLRQSEACRTPSSAEIATAMRDRSTSRPQMRDRAPRHRHGRRWLVAAGYAGLGLGCLLLGAIAFLVVAAPVELLRDRLIGEIKARTGRDLVVSGSPPSLFFPRLAISPPAVASPAPPACGAG